MTRSPRLQDLQWRIEYAVLRSVAAIFRSLPLNFATNASAIAWRRLAPIINPKRHKRALDNLAIAFPEKTQAERQEIALKHWENLGRVMVETMRIDRFLAEPERVDIVSQNIFSRYKDKLGAAGPVTSAQVKTGKFFKAAGKGVALGHTLATDPSPVDVVLTVGTRQYCVHFGGVEKFKVGKLSAKDAPAAGACP